jgi:hypothetical protein
MIQQLKATLQLRMLVLTKDNPLISAAIKVQERHTAELMSLPDVVGTAVGLLRMADPASWYLQKLMLKQML